MNKIHTMLILSALIMASTAAKADDDTPVIEGGVFGGGRMAPVSNTATQASGTDNSVTCTVDIYASTITGGVYGGNDITGDDWQKDHGSESADNHSAKVTIHNTDADPTVIDEVYGGGNGNYTYCFTYYPIGTSTGSYNYVINADALKDNPNLKWLFTQKAPTGGLTVKAYPADATEYTDDNLIATYTIAAGSSLTNAIPIIHNSTVTIGDAVNPTNEVVRIGEVYGGAKNAWVSGNTEVTVNSATIGKVFAGNNLGGVVYNTSLTINGTKKHPSYTTDDPTATLFADLDWTNVGSWEDATNGYGIGEAYGGGNAVDVQTAAKVTMNGGYVGTLFGGNNLADMSAVPSVLFHGGNIGTSYGGGNAGDMQGCEAAYLDISQYLNNDLFEANNNLASFKNAGITFTDYCNTSNYLYFYGAETLIAKDADKTLNIGNVYGGCRAANVDLSTYVRLADADYIGSIYGGCDMAGSVGAKPTESTGVIVNSGTALTKAEMEIEYYDIANKDGYAKSTTKLPQYFPIINLSSIVTIMGSTVSGDMFAGGNGDYQYVIDGDYTKVYANSDKAQANMLTSFKTSDMESPWTVSSIAAMEGGTLTGNLYGGGNNADVGKSGSQGRVYVLLGKTKRGILSDGATGPKATGTIYAGGKKSNVYGTVDVLVKAGCDINTLYAGNDISGEVTGSNRGNYLAGTAASAITTVLKGTANDGTTANNTYCGWRLDQPNGDANDKAQVYVRVEGAGQDADGTARSAAKITTLYGGSNGDYDYTTETSQYYGLTKPVSKSNFLDVKGIVGTCYGGGNAADVEVTNTYITGDAQVTRAFGGGNAATVTEEVNLYLDCDGTRGTQDYVDGSDASKTPNVGLLFAGNNQASMNITPIATLKRGSVQTVYGGGNEGSMLGSWAMLTDQSAYMDKGTDSEDGTSSWGKQMETNFKGISWYEDEEETKSINFDMDKVIAFVGTNITIDSPYEESTDNGKIVISDNPCKLVVGDVYAGCRAANVSNGAYVRVTHCDYIHEIYGGCDISGSVGASPGTLNGAKDSKFDVHWVDGSTGTRHTGHAKYTDDNVSIPMWNAATWVIFTGGTCDGNIYGSGNGDYTYSDPTDGKVKVTDTAGNVVGSITASSAKDAQPWVIGTTLFIEGGTIKGNIYGGGNKADVGHQVKEATHFYDKDYAANDYLPSSSFLCIGKADLGRSDVTIDNDVFGGGRISDINGTIDIITLQDVTINRLFAGNDISGSIKGLWRGTRFSTAENEICCFTGSGVFANPASSFSGTKFKATNANVYARIMPGAKITQLFGGGNGDYTYSGTGTVSIKTKDNKDLGSVTATDADAAKPYQGATWLDVLGHVGTAYGGGNASNVGTSSLWIVNNAQVGTAFAGGNSATVTENAQVFVYCNPAVYGTDNNTSADGYIINEPEHLASTSTLSNTIYNVGTVYGGNNTADMSVVPRVIMSHGKVGTVYGGGNAGSMKGTKAGVTDASGYLRDGLVTSPFSATNYPIVASAVVYVDAPDYTADQKTALTKNSLYSGKTDCISKSKFTGLRIDRMYGGCRAANVDFSTYIQLTRIDYMGDVFGGCDIAGSVGAVSVSTDKTKSASYAKATKELPVYQYDVTNHKVVESTTLKYAVGTPYISTGAYIAVTDGTIQGNVFGGGNGEYKYSDEGSSSCKAYTIGSDGNASGDALATFDNTTIDRPWNACSYVIVEGGNLKKNIYLGGNNATIGKKNAGTTYMLGYDIGDYSVFASGLLIGQSSRTPEGTTINIEGDVFAGGRMADVYGTVDALIKKDVKVNRFFAGNDIAGTVTGNGRDGVSLGATTIRNGSLLYASADELGGSMTSAKTTYNGTELTSMTGQVYVRVEKDAEITTLFGGGNGDYTYNVSDNNVTYDDNGSLITFTASGSTDAEKIASAKPFQLSSWLDIKGKVGTVYGGGNAANNDYTHVFVTGDAEIGTTTTNGAVYGGCKSADVNYASTVVLSPFTDKNNIVTNPTVYGNVFGGCDISGNVGCTRSKGRLDIKNYGIKIESNNSIQIGDAISEGTFTLDDPVKLVTASNLESYRSSTKTYYVYNKYAFSNVLLYGGKVTGRVFGGGNGLQSADGTSYGSVSTEPTSGAISSGDDVYSYTSGTYSGKTLPQVENSWVVARGCTVGTTTGSDTHTIFGGGQGAGTRVVHNVDLQIGNTTATTTINGISYGGSYSGFVNSDCQDHTTTTLLGNGTTTSVKGDIYGGSYGNYVRGTINLNINNISVGVDDAAASIYAGNNNAGQPECTACLNFVGNGCNTTLYGGGNKAPFYGTTRITFTTGEIGYIYGGGNQAPVYGNTIVEVLGGHVCHDVYGGGNNGAVLENKASDTDHNSYGKDYGGNTLVIVRDDCLQPITDSNGKNPGETGYVNTFAKDDITGNCQANRGTTSYFNTNADGTEMSDKVDPYTADKQLYVLKPNSDTAPVKAIVTIDGNVYGGGNNADVAHKATVILGDK